MLVYCLIYLTTMKKQRENWNIHATFFYKFRLNGIKNELLYIKSPQNHTLATARHLRKTGNPTTLMIILKCECCKS